MQEGGTEGRRKVGRPVAGMAAVARIVAAVLDVV